MSKEKTSSQTDESAPVGSVSEKPKEETDEPAMYRVILMNDHYTTMEFVVAVLMKVFHKSESEARMIMLDVHKKGSGVCGVYTRDIAQTKVDDVHRLARKNEFPLRCVCEPE